MGTVDRPRWAKLALLLSVASAVVACGFLLAAAPAFATEAPIAAYSFDEAEGEAAHDLSGNGHEGAVEEANWSGGKFGSSLYFNGEGCVTVPDSSQLQLSGSFTIEAWVRPQNGGGAPIVFKETEGFYSYSLFLGAFKGGIAEGFVSPEGEAFDEVTAAEELPVKAWSYLTMTSDGTHLRLYVDGELVDTASVKAAKSSKGPLLIGCSKNFNEHFTGRIDEVRIYDRALPSGEIGEDMETAVQTPPSQEPIAAYSFDEDEGETAFDVSGNGHDGTIEGARFTGGKFGSALYFDGESCVSIPDSTALQLSGDFTLEAWVRPQDEGGAPLIFKESEGFYGYSAFLGAFESGHAEGFVSPDGSSYAEVSSSETLPVRAWSHLALTSDGSHLRLYVNGELVDTAATQSAEYSNGPLLIGCSKDFAEYFKGLIDEVRVYNRALPLAEIDEGMETAIQSPPSLVAAYTFDEGEGEVAEDSSGDGHSGTVEGAKWIEGKYGKALEFDGKDDCVTIPNSNALRLDGNLTIEAWVRLKKSNAFAPVIFKESEGFYGYSLFDGGFEAGHPEAFISDGTEPWAEATLSEALPAETWSNLAMTSDGKQLRLYVNGELVDTGTTRSAQYSNGPLLIGCSKTFGEYFEGAIDQVRLYDRDLSEGEVKADMLNDGVPPKITLSGKLTEGLKEGTTEYPLKVHATDGEPGSPGVGVKSITISVDGEVVDSVEQECPEGNCSLDREWTFDTEKYGFDAHEVEVVAEDQGGNVAAKPLPLPVANGSIPACSASGTQPESPPDETESLSGGGNAAIYHGFEGEEIRFPSAPSGFNPKVASAEELALYGYPSKPPSSEAAALEAWEETVGEASQTAEPGGCMQAGVSQPIFATQASISGLDGTLYNEINSGYVARDGSGPRNHWRGAISIYHQPELGNICRGLSAAVATWAGVGGVTEHDAFFQAGTNEPFGYSPKIQASAFTEYFLEGHEFGHAKKNERPMHVNLKIVPGDNIVAAAEWKPAKNAVLMTVINTGTAKNPKHEIDSVEVVGAESKLYDGREVWFNAAERAANSLQSFKPLKLRGNAGLVSGEGWKGLSHLEHLHRQVMQANNNKGEQVGQIMASPSPILSDGLSFNENWRHCHS